jgi:hypothetical protein
MTSKGMLPFDLSYAWNQLTDFSQCLLYFEHRGVACIDRDCSVAPFSITGMHDTIGYFFDMKLMEAWLDMMDCFTRMPMANTLLSSPLIMAWIFDLN